MAVTCTPSNLVELAACFTGISPAQQAAISTYLLCQIANSGGGGGGSAIWGDITGTLSNQTDLQAALNAAASTAVWGGIAGTLSNQTDLQTALNAKLNLSGGQLTGNLTFSADNTLDIGASGATRPRRGYFGTEVVSPLFTGSLTGASSLNVLKAGDTMTGLLTIAQATANTSALAITGYSLTGANAQSMLTLAGTWNTSGTPTAIDLIITDTASNASSLLLALRVGASTVFSVDKSGNSISGAAIIATTNLICGASGQVIFNNRSKIRSGVDGDIQLGNFANTGFGLLKLGGATSAFPAFKRSSALVQVRLADDSAFSELECSNAITNNAAAAISTNTTLTDFAAAQIGTITNAPTAGNPAKWIAIDDNGTTRYIPTWV